jgi:beta-phosphoglucomutase
MFDNSSELDRSTSQVTLRVACVIFDMDGVITNTMPYHYEAWRQVYHNHGISISFEDIYKREGQPGIRSVQEILCEKGITKSDEDMRRMLTEKEAHFKSIVEQRFIDGSLDWLRDLHGQGFRLALVTGTAEHEMKTMLPGPVQSCFDVIVTGDQVTHGKPHPDPYLNALEARGMTADQAVVIVNAPFGIAAAKAAGILCVALETSLDQDHLQEADFCFRSIDELRDRITLHCHPKHP